MFSLRISKLKQLLIMLLVSLFSTTACAQDPSDSTDQNNAEWAADYPVGSELGDFLAVDQDGQEQVFTNLVGEKGLLILFNRSAVW